MGGGRMMGGSRGGGHWGGAHVMGGPRFSGGSRFIGGSRFAGARFHHPFFHNRFAFRHRFFHRRFFAFSVFPYDYDYGCWQWWHGRYINVCYGPYGTY